VGSRDEYVASIKAAFVTLGVKAAMSSITAQLPFLATPIISKVVEHFVSKILVIVADHVEMGAFFTYIDVRTSAQGREFEKAAIENRLIQQSGTAEEKKNAEEKLWHSFVQFARLSS